MHKVIFLLLWPSCAVNLNAQIFKSEKSLIDVTKDVYIFEDRSSSMAFNEVSHSKNLRFFKKNNDLRINFGISTSAIWIKFRMPETLNQFQLSSPNIHELAVYSLDGVGRYQEINTGFLSTFDTRAISYDRFTFNVLPGTWCFVRMRSGHFVNTKIFIGSPTFFLTESQKRTVFYSIYLGTMLIIAAYALFFFFQDRRPYLLFYLGYVVVITIINLTEKGFFLQYLWSENASIHKVFPIFPFLVSICLILFIDDLFKIRKKFFQLFQFLLYFVIAIPAFLVIIFLLVDIYHLAIIVAQVHSISICGIVIYMLFEAYTRDSRFTVHLLLLGIGILLFSASVIIYLLAENGIFPVNFVTENCIILGSVLEVLFSTATIVLYQKTLRERLRALTLNQNSLLRKKVEERTRELINKNDRLEESIIEKENLVSIIAHDLKSPLNQTKALSQLVQREIGQCDDEAIKLARHIEKVSNHGLQLIKELFEVSILEANSEKILFTRVDLKELSQEIIENFAAISQKKQIELEFNCQGEVMINTYSPYVVRIFENILSNAIKFSPSGTRVEISVQDLHSVALVSIKDMGPGFHEEDKKRMFKKFQKLSAVPTAGESSNGLGLYIIKTLASRINALITVESEVGKGTIFSFSCPRT